MSTIEQALSEIDFNIKPDSTSYENKYGNPIPRVTEILSKTIHEQGLMHWANSLGFKRLGYQKELNKAANTGTKAHNAIEKFLKHGIITEDNVSFMAFLSWWNMLNKNNTVEVLFIEERLRCDYFGGTCDLILRINGKVFLVDFKTSNHVTYKYSLQLAAYRYMLFVDRNINIDGTIILQLSKEEPSFNEMVLDFTNKEHYFFMEECTRAFLALVYSYYHIIYIENLYKKLY